MCLTPIPSSTQGIRSELNSRNPTILPLKHHQKLCRTPYKVQQLGLTATKSPSGGHLPLGATASRPPGGGHVPPGAKRQAPQNPQTQQSSPGRIVPTARRTCSSGSLFPPLSPGGTFPSARRHLHQNPSVSLLSPGECCYVAKRCTSDLNGTIIQATRPDYALI